MPSCNGSCDGTAVIVTTGGQPPYSILGPATNAPQTYSSIVTLTGICAGFQTFVVTDALNQSTPVIVSIMQPSALVLTPNPTNETSVGACNGQIVSATTGGTSPYTYTLNGMNQPSGNLSNLCAGTYQVCVTDANGCTTCQSVTINAGTGCSLVTTQFQHTPASCFGTCDGSLVLAASGGQMPYIVSGNFPGSPFTFTSSAYLQGLCGGTSVLTVTSNDGCVGVMNVTIVEPTPIQLATSIVSNISSAGELDQTLSNGLYTVVVKSEGNVSASKLMILK